MTMYRNVIAAAAVAVLMSSQVANAGLTVYTGESTFTGALTSGTLKTENFETLGGESAPVSLFSGGLGTLTGPNTVRTAAENGRHSIGGGTNYWLGGAQPFEISFAAGIQAFGFWGTDIGDFSNDCTSSTAGCSNSGGSVKVEFFKLATDATAAFSDTFTGADSNGNELFRGYVDSSGAVYQKIRITNLQAQWDGQGFDQLMIGDVAIVPPDNRTPEPGMLALLGLGLLGVVGSRRRR